ncbi:MAG: ChaN family lipoprotein [Gammaproteobacteria bacterium]|nr:ChaN family lipoprotein [Gammaproteobacteria bacterium]
MSAIVNTSFSSALHSTTTPSIKPVTNLPVIKMEQTDPLVKMIDDIDRARVILVGETHTRYDHHLVQLEILKLLYQKPSKLAIGVEWFQQPVQKYLDAYITGDIDEAEMLHQTGYFDRWRYDYRLYRPIMQYAREHNIPVIALNASKELSESLRENGFDDLPEELKQQLPKSYDWSDKAYEQRLRVVFEQHPEYSDGFEDFLRGQLTWDESMAERAAEYLQSDPDVRMLVLAGSGHIAYGSGIPNRIKRRIDVEQYSILISEDYLTMSKESADFLVLSPVQALAPAGLIGAFLETEGKLLTIKDFSADSAVKDAGLKAGNVIIAVDDVAVKSFADFKLAVLDKKPGDIIELHYIDSAESGHKDKKTVKIELR